MYNDVDEFLLSNEDLDLEFYEGIQRRNKKYGAQEDSNEMISPYIGWCPDESNTEDGSPLKF